MKPRIGIIGSGRLGTALARLSLAAGYDVRITNSRTPESLSLILSVLLPGAQAVSLRELAEQSDIIILAIPLHRYDTIDPAILAGKLVIDAMNYWPPTEGIIQEIESSPSSSEFIQSYFYDATVVKTLGHIAYSELEEDSEPELSLSRRAIAVAGNNEMAKQLVGTYVSRLGFDPVDLGELSQGRLFQPDTELFNARFDAKTLQATGKRIK